VIAAPEALCESLPPTGGMPELIATLRDGIYRIAPIFSQDRPLARCSVAQGAVDSKPFRSAVPGDRRYKSGSSRGKFTMFMVVR
jgi:hypothetical protein